MMDRQKSIVRDELAAGEVQATQPQHVLRGGLESRISHPVAALKLEANHSGQGRHALQVLIGQLGMGMELRATRAKQTAAG